LKRKIVNGNTAHSVNFGSEKLQFSVVYRDRKTLSINVYPDLSIEAVAPKGTDIQKIGAKVKKRAPWILKQQGFFQSFLPSTPPRKYVSGETHRYLGKQYRLKLYKSASEEVKLKAGFICVYTKDKGNKFKVKALLETWYRKNARKRFEDVIQKLLPKLSRYKIKEPALELKAMSKRWGSCSINGKIILNPHLIRSPSHCIEYVVMHELCHLVEPSHSPRYYRLLEKMMPDWERRKERLERSYA